MAEIQQATNSSDLTQKFIELVMMQAQQAALCLGQMEHPSTGKAEINLEAARMFIDHLEVIREKTKGNLSNEEEKILSRVLSELQLAFVHVAGASGASSQIQPHVHDENCTHGAHGDAAVETLDPPTTQSTVSSEPAPSKSVDEDEGKKKFSKSYGA